MVQDIILCQLKDGLGEEALEIMMRETRIRLLKIPEIRHVRCGKKIDPAMPWPFFVAVEYETMDKKRMAESDAIHVTFVEQVLKPHAAKIERLVYEMEPGKDVRYS